MIFYIKNINDKGLDFNIFLEGKISNLNITGYIVDFHDVTKIDNNKKILDENLEEEDTKGIYDKGIQNGIIEFNKIDENIRDYDIYYVVMISLSNTNINQNYANLSSKIVIDAYPREDRNNIIPPRKYIRGMFDLGANSEGKIYYIEECYYCKIFFSSNYKNFQIIIDDNNTKIENKSLGYAQIYTIKGHIDKFSIKLINNEYIITNNSNTSNNISNFNNFNSNNSNTSNNSISNFNNSNSNNINNTNNIKNSNININYIFIYEINPKNNRFISEKNISHKIPSETNKGNKRDITISFYNNRTNENQSNHSRNSYYLRLYKDKDKIEDEDLNTLAITSSESFYFNESLDNNNSQINFTINNINNNESYLGYLIIKSSQYYQETYEIYNFNIDIKQNKENNDKKGISYQHIIIMIISPLIIIIIIIFSNFLMKMKKKNKELEEKVKNISFGIKDDDTDSLDDDISPRVSYI